MVVSLTKCTEVMEGAENMLTVSGTMVRLRSKNKAEHPGVIEMKYCN